MRHAVPHRKLNRTTEHRMLMLRNMVSSLLQHEQIKTTVPKAKEAARLAEKMITLGKKGTLAAKQAADAFLINPSVPSSSGTTKLSLTSILFENLAPRYASRSGGYTRIHRVGSRVGDNADAAVLELVDSPRDLKFAVAARAAAREGLQRGSGGLWNGDSKVLREVTRKNVGKVLAFRGEERKQEFDALVEEHQHRILGESSVGLRRVDKARPVAKGINTITLAHTGKRRLAGERLSGMPRSEGSALGLAKGSFRKLGRGGRARMVEVEGGVRGPRKVEETVTQSA